MQYIKSICQNANPKWQAIQNNNTKFVLLKKKKLELYSRILTFQNRGIKYFEK